MLSIQNWIKFLFPNEVLAYHLSDLNNKLHDEDDRKKRIHFSIEKHANCRQFCSLILDQLDILFEHCPVSQRTLYECISPSNPLKAYIDFEYYLSQNCDLDNNDIGLQSCLKILDYFLNPGGNEESILDRSNENILKQFLVLEALPECTFQPNVSDLIQCLAPYVVSLRRSCSGCSSNIPNVSVGDLAHLLIKDQSNHWNIAIDINVYTNNQQFRLFNCVKYGKNNPLILSKNFPFDKYCQYSTLDILHLSLISFNPNTHIGIISYENDRFLVNQANNSLSELEQHLFEMMHRINLLNEYLQSSTRTGAMKQKSDMVKDSANLNFLRKQRVIDLLHQSVAVFTTFVDNLIKSDPSHQGYIHSCVRGNYNPNIIFFNIRGNYRYCPKQKRHHRRNSVAIMINTVKYTYSIRCKDIDCDNSMIQWKSLSD